MKYTHAAAALSTAGFVDVRPNARVEHSKWGWFAVVHGDGKARKDCAVTIQWGTSVNSTAYFDDDDAARLINALANQERACGVPAVGQVQR